MKWTYELKKNKFSWSSESTQLCMWFKFKSTSTGQYYKPVLQAVQKDIEQFPVDVGGQRRALLHKAALLDKPL